MKWLPTHEILSVICTCYEWNSLGREEYVWREFYDYKYLRFNPNTSPVRKNMETFRSRFFDPQIGDGVEVSWNGKFRLESSDVYNGLAWWVAVVVDKHPSQGKYKIHYPGWESRWDEWVVRSRLRWSVDRNTVETIRTNDTVELWCCGSLVPGAWLEAKIKKIRGKRYCIGRVLQNGNLWVERDRIRLVKRAAESDAMERQRTSTLRRSLTSHVTINASDAGCSMM